MRYRYKKALNKRNESCEFVLCSFTGTLKQISPVNLTDCHTCHLCYRLGYRLDAVIGCLPES